MNVIKSRFTLTAVAAALALALSTPAALAQVAPPQITTGGGYVALCVVGGSNPPPCAPNPVAAGTQATGDEAIAIGASAQATGNGGIAIGTTTYATGQDATAVGDNAQAVQYDDTALGFEAFANGGYATALGSGASATGAAATATGAFASASGSQSLALGVLANASGQGSIAEGYGSGALGTNAVAIGTDAVATGADASAFGYASNAFGAQSTAMSFSSAWTPNSTALGYDAIAGSTPTDPTANQTAVGAYAEAVGNQSVALGANSSAAGAGSVAIGAGSVANRANSVSVGDANAGLYRQITNVAAGTMPTDAVDLAQLQAETSALGGGASYAGGVFTAPQYVFGSTSFSDVGSALSYLYSGSIVGANVTNGSLFLLTAGGSSIDAGNVIGPQGPAGPQGPQGATGATGAQGAAGQNAPSGPGSDSSAVHYDSNANGSINYQSVTLQGTGGTMIHNLSAGVAPTDAANVSQVQQAETTAISTSESYSTNYTNAALAPINGQISALGLAVSQMSNRLDGLGASEQASAQMAMACEGSRNCIAAGFGMQAGQGAVSLGFRHSLYQGRAAWTIGVSSSDAGTSVGAGFSINLH